MTTAFHVPGTAHGWLRRFDARWKLAAAFVLAVVVVLLHRPEPIMLGVLAIFLIALSTGVTLRTMSARLGPIVGMLLLVLGWSIVAPRAGETPWHLGPIDLSPTALGWLVGIVGKTSALLLLAIAFVETTPMPEIGHAARSLGLPGPIVHLVLLTQRYVFVIGDEFDRLRTALRVRGYRNRASRHCWRTIGQVAGSLIVRSCDRAEGVHHAMTCRGFAGNFRPLHEPRTRLVDVSLLVASVLLAAGLAGWNWA